MNISEEQYALVARMNVMDDPLFQKIAEDPEVCEEILRILLHKPQLKIVANQTQRYLRNLNAHSVILDLLCQDDTGSCENPLFPKLTARVRFFKQEQEGVFEMMSVFDEYAEEKVQEAEKTTANNLLKEGLSIDFIAKVLPSLSVDVIKQLKQQLPQA